MTATPLPLWDLPEAISITTFRAWKNIGRGGLKILLKEGGGGGGSKKGDII